MFRKYKDKWPLVLILFLTVSLLFTFIFAQLLKYSVIPFIVLVGIVIGASGWLYNSFKSKHQTKNASANNIIQILPQAAMLVKESRIFNYNRPLQELLKVDEEGLRNKALSEVFPSFPNQLNEHEDIRLSINGGALIEVSHTSWQEDGETIRLFLFKGNEFATASNEKRFHVEQLSVLGELAAGIAHEIRNPLTSLKGFLQLMKNNDASNVTYTNIMLSEIERINSIVGELLLLAKPKKFNMKRNNVIPILDSVLTILDTQASLHNVQIKLSFDHHKEPLYLLSDENKLKQVFINILKNSIEAMPHGGIIEIKLKKEHSFACFSFIDQGSGMSSEKLAHLGNSFYTTKSEGTGLGLMMCKHIISEHQGELMIESEEDRGTNVSITFPYHKKA
ncbi:ATP-binding protein [Bacillus suaedae]|uniref:histidine kinase n=1 Tax=Halalkalibacter suaedae TaxID=2822140 RepID=A0A941AP65_9BACI|nr:ATP-binding protein [Bacillus suaedae]MBP3952435.1 GHKL domain-containing protein [Bacillus suaedae]